MELRKRINNVKYRCGFDVVKVIFISENIKFSESKGYTPAAASKTRIYTIKQQCIIFLLYAEPVYKDISLIKIVFYT